LERAASQLRQIFGSDSVQASAIEREIVDAEEHLQKLLAVTEGESA
jgi:hypothetical protein